MDVGTLLNIIEGVKGIHATEARALELLCVAKLSELVSVPQDIIATPPPFDEATMTAIQRLNDMGLLGGRRT